MSDYQITEHLGCFALTINNQLIAQATDRATLERMKTSFENSNHAERVLRNTYYDAGSNEIRDGIEAR
ncbi:hypothetical protein [Glutamicibacter arilaitensis]|uniref:Uncharacterized protein n=1 Tax=Glutamicibacter arilaitensis TaxID=256701 RepID=A0A4Y8TYL4_9MICC|nr:hypothetical protein [Glutamicibacter arilaitensis]TFH57295.1 hypothetical protein EXY26_09955 [Glutamicibacter arilaitensis]